MASTGCRSIMVRRSTVRRDFGAPGLRCAGTSAHTGVNDCLGVCGAPGLRYTGSTVHWDPRLSWRLRCAGTAVRRDFGAPGLRCTEATSSAASTHRRPGSPHRSEQRAAPAVPVPRTGLLDLAASHGRTPPRARSSSGPGSGGIHPCPSPAALREQLRGYQRRTPAPCPLGAGILLLTEPPSWVPSTPRRLCGSMLSRAYVDHLAPQRRGNSGGGAVRGAGLLRDDRDRRAAPGRVVENAATRPRDAAANDSRTPHRGRTTNSHHLGRRQAAAKPQQARRGDTETATTALENTISRLVRAPREPHGERKCQFRIFTCNAPARKPTQLGADGRACGARGGAARLRRPPAAQANVGPAESRDLMMRRRCQERATHSLPAWSSNL